MAAVNHLRPFIRAAGGRVIVEERKKREGKNEIENLSAFLLRVSWRLLLVRRGNEKLMIQWKNYNRDLIQD